MWQCAEKHARLASRQNTKQVSIVCEPRGSEHWGRYAGVPSRNFLARLWNQWQNNLRGASGLGFMSPQMTGNTQQNTKTTQVHIPAASAAGNTSVSVTLDPQAQLESDKRAVYR